MASSNAVRDMTNEPMVKALGKALEAVRETGEPIDVAIALALGNNGSHKHHQCFSPALTDPAGASPIYFGEQAAAYRRLTSLGQSKQLFDGISAEPLRSRG